MSTSTTSSNKTETDPKGCNINHVRYCMDVLLAHFEKREPISPPFENPDEEFALFVTWNTTERARPNGNGKPALRGCIGNFSPMPLAKGLKQYALISALEDTRFNPISRSELPKLSCSVSLLTPTRPIKDPLDWTPGVHGIQISFTYPSSSSSGTGTGTSRRLSATYLPEIATDQGWTREETILSAIQKAGYRKRVEVGDAVWKSLQVGVYESTKCALGWAEFEDWKQGRG